MAARLDQAAETAVVILARTGDAAAFRELVQRRQVRVRDLLRRLCGDHTLGEDLAQETFVQAWKSLHQLQNPGVFGPWLRQVALNVWRQDVRRRRLILADEDEILNEPDPRPASATDDRLDLITALATLRTAERLCVVLSYAEGMTHGEIADATGLPLGTVKSHVKRGGDKLKSILAIGDGDD